MCLKDSHTDKNLNAIVNCHLHVCHIERGGVQAEFNCQSSKTSDEINVRVVCSCRGRQETAYLGKRPNTFSTWKSSCFCHSLPSFPRVPSLSHHTQSTILHLFHFLMTLNLADCSLYWATPISCPG